MLIISLQIEGHHHVRDKKIITLASADRLQTSRVAPSLFFLVELSSNAMFT
jgi:hypothetical protein